MSPASAITCVERVIVAVSDLAAARDRWTRAGFGCARGEFRAAGLRFASLAAGAVEIDLGALEAPAAAETTPLAAAVRAAIGREPGVIGWVWGTAEPAAARAGAPDAFDLPGPGGAAVTARALHSGLPGVFTAIVQVHAPLDLESRRQALAQRCGPNANTVDYLEHVVVMVPQLDAATAALEAAGVPCKRIREIGNGARQAFFRLEQTVLEVVGPSERRPGCWGLALMCSDIRRAVAHAREHGFQATEPKDAKQGGLIARIIEPLDGVAIAFMQPGSRRDT